jgi:hypothetical protein
MLTRNIGKRAEVIAFHEPEVLRILTGTPLSPELVMDGHTEKGSG